MRETHCYYSNRLLDHGVCRAKTGVRGPEGQIQSSVVPTIAGGVTSGNRLRGDALRQSSFGRPEPTLTSRQAAPSLPPVIEESESKLELDRLVSDESRVDPNLGERKMSEEDEKFLTSILYAPERKGAPVAQDTRTSDKVSLIRTGPPDLEGWMSSNITVGPPVRRRDRVLADGEESQESTAAVDYSADVVGESRQDDSQDQTNRAESPAPVVNSVVVPGTVMDETAVVSYSENDDVGHMFDRSVRERMLQRSLGPEGVLVSHPELSEKAVAVIRRVMDKLTGVDFAEGVTVLSPNYAALVRHHPNMTPLDVTEQVDKLIRQATANENLSLCFFGWCPFW